MDFGTLFKVKAHGLGIVAAPLVVTLLIVAVILTSTFGVKVISDVAERWLPSTAAEVDAAQVE